MKTMTLHFPGGKKVDACFEVFTVHTDQRFQHGGEETAPNPFDLFFVSIATCAGISALEFCQKNEIETKGLDITLKAHRHPVQPRYDRIEIHVTLPEIITPEQTEALLEEINDCSVKRHILKPPEFEIICNPV